MNRTIRLVAATALLASGAACAPRLARVELTRLETAGKVAVIVAPRRWTPHDLLGMGGGADVLEKAYGSPPPWRGEKLMGVSYQPGPVMYFPIGVDLRELARERTAAAARKTLKLTVVSSAGPAYERFAGSTYYSQGFSYAGPVDFESDRAREGEELKALAGEGISAVIIVSPIDMALVRQTGAIGLVMKLYVYETASGKLVHESSSNIYTGASAALQVPPEVFNPFFPEVPVAATIFGISEQVEAYRKAFKATPAEVAALREKLGGVMDAWLEQELARIGS